jgi:sarcosine oxidase
VYRQVQFWFDIEQSIEAFRPEHFPVFIWDLPNMDGGIYGFPALDRPAGGIKIATEQYEKTTTPGTVDRTVRDEEMRAMHEHFVAPYLRGVGRKCVKAAACLYTVTPDFGFVVDRHPETDRVIVASPCSGHGFKHSAAVGEAICELALDGRSRQDLGAFGFERLWA